MACIRLFPFVGTAPLGDSPRGDLAGGICSPPYFCAPQKLLGGRGGVVDSVLIEDDELLVFC